MHKMSSTTRCSARNCSAGIRGDDKILTTIIQSFLSFDSSPRVPTASRAVPIGPSFLGTMPGKPTESES